MNNNSYRELLEKYYSGLTSAEEERWLKSNGHLPQLTELNEEQPVMNWSFGEFLAQANKQQSIPRKGLLQKMPLLKHAAAVTLLALLAIALYTTKKEKAPRTSTALNLQPVVQKENTIKDSGNPVQPVPAINKAIATSKPVRKRKSSAPVKQQPAPQNNDDFFVMVDGKRITNENEALAILQQSLHALSGNVQQTIAGINNSPKLDVKFK